ncbi:MAG: tetratricopeptide repeat protein, partial [Proteobacteria bacterium]|nr:tetratricopeptide repeat protein [Pseudomonadota bacterium]
IAFWTILRHAKPRRTNPYGKSRFNALSYSAQNTNNIQKLLQQRLRLAVEDLQQGRLDAAEKSLGELLIQAPGDADILSLLGMAATRKGNPETAIPLMKRAITADPENTVHRFNLGTAYLSLFRYDDAVAVLNEFLTIDPRHAAAAFNLGKALQALGRNEEAALAFLGAMKNRPGYTKAISARAGCLLETGDIDSAAVLLRDSIAAHPEDLDLRFTLGRLMLLRREWNSAVEAFDAALSIRHWHVSSAAFKGIALREAGMDADAAAADGLDRH